MLLFPGIRVVAMLAINISLLAFAPGGAYAKPSECKDINAMTAEIQRVSTAEEAWKEIFSWARGLHNDIAEPKSNDELSTKAGQLQRAPRSDWDRIIHEPIQQIERQQIIGGLDKDGEVKIDDAFVQSHTDEIVEGVRVHERAHRDFFLSPGNVLEAGLMSSRHLRIRSESEVVSYGAQKAFLDETLKAIRKRCKGYRPTKLGEFALSGVICSLEKPFSISGTMSSYNTVIVTTWKFVPASETAGTFSIGLFRANAPGVEATGTPGTGGSYTIVGADTDNPRIVTVAQGR